MILIGTKKTFLSKSKADKVIRLNLKTIFLKLEYDLKHKNR